MNSKELIHSGLSTKDLEACINFYVTAFGFEVIFKENNIKKEIESITGVKNLSCSLAQLSIPGSNHLLELLQFHGLKPNGFVPPKLPLHPGQGHIAFNVKDMESCIAKVTDLGAKPLGSITKFPEGRAAYFCEPSGTFFEISEAKYPEAEDESN